MELVEVDLTKAHKSDHPDIDDCHYFLAEISCGPSHNSRLEFGKFKKQWFGWNFACGWGCSGMQFDAPGYNSSVWLRLWKVVR